MFLLCFNNIQPLPWGCLSTPNTQQKEVRNLTSHFDTKKLGKVTKMNPKRSPRRPKIHQKLVKNNLWLQGVSFRASWAAPGHQNEPKGPKMTPQGPQNIRIGVQNTSQKCDSDTLSGTHIKVNKNTTAPPLQWQV